jgi:NADP-dependent aldehyde dehydrogenase
VAPRLFSASAQEFIGEAEIREECFGPAAIAVTAADADELLDVIAALDGQLTGTIHLGESDSALAPEIATALGRKVGRLVFNGFPTGVEVGQAMQHGGPYPATTDSRFTSVGAQAIFRFLRPIAIQNAPDGLEFSL